MAGKRTLTLVETRRDEHTEALIAEGIDPETAGAYARQAHPYEEPVEDDAQPEQPEQPEPESPVARQFNEHDVNSLQKECQGLVNAMARLGAAVDMPRVEASAGTYAILRILVTRGVCSESEAEGERFTAMRDILRQGLQQVEIQAAQRDGKRVQAVRGPGLVVARH